MAETFDAKATADELAVDLDWHFSNDEGDAISDKIKAALEAAYREGMQVTLARLKASNELLNKWLADEELLYHEEIAALVAANDAAIREAEGR